MSEPLWKKREEAMLAKIRRNAQHRTIDERIAEMPGAREKLAAALTRLEVLEDVRASERSRLDWEGMSPTSRLALETGAACRSLVLTGLVHKMRFIELYEEIARLRSELAETRRSSTFDIAARHCGVWKAARAYNRNDLVQWQGAAWFARKDSPEGRPDESPDWGQFLNIPRGK